METGFSRCLQGTLFAFGMPDVLLMNFVGTQVNPLACSTSALKQLAALPHDSSMSP